MITQSLPGYPALVLRLWLFSALAASFASAAPSRVEITSSELAEAGLDWYAFGSETRQAALESVFPDVDWGALSLRQAETGLAVGAFDSAALGYRDFLRFSPLDPGRPEATLGMGRAVLGKKFPQGAREVLRRGREAFGSSAAIDELIFWEGEACWQTEDHEAAGALFRDLLARFPESPLRGQALYRLAWVEDRQGDYAAAETHFEQAGKLSPELAASSSLQCAWVKLISGRPKEAADLFEETQARFAGSSAAREALIGRAEAAYHEKDFSRARELYNDALALAETPEARAAIMYGLAWTALKQKRLAASREQFLEVKTKFPDQPVAPFASYRAALCLLDLGKPDDALSELARVRDDYARHEVGQWAQYSTGWINLANARYNEAKAAFRSLMDEYPAGMLVAPAKYLFATAQFKERRFREAGREFVLLAEEHPMSGLADGALLWAGWAALLDGDPDEALGRLSEMRRRYPDSPLSGDAALARGESLFAKKNYAEARKAYSEAAGAEKETRLRGLSGLGWCAFAAGDWMGAEKWFGILLNEAPEGELKLRARVRLGDALFNQKRYADADKHYRRAVSGGIDMLARWAQYQSGWCQLRQGKWENALNEWEQLRRRWPGSDDAHLALNAIGEALFNQEKFADAERAFSRLTEEAPAGSDMAQGALLRVGDCLYNAKAYDGAVLAYRRFTQQYPESPRMPEALYGIQWAYLQLGEFEKSRREASEFLKRYPQASLAPEVQLMVADSYRREGKASDAIRQYRELVDRYQSDVLAASARFKIGEIHQAEGNSAAAAQAYEEFLAKHPDHAQAREASFKLGVACYGMGDLAKAAGIFEKIAKETDNPFAAQALYNLLLCNKQLGREDAMKDALGRLKERYPASRAAWQARLSVAYYLVDAGREDEAIPLLAEIVEGPYKDLHGEAACALGDAYGVNGQKDKALATYQAGAGPLPGGDAWTIQCAMLAANLLGEAGKHAEGVDLLRRVLEKRDATFEQMAAAYFGIGRHYEGLGKPDQARLMYKRCLDSKPGKDLAGRARQRIAALEPPAPKPAETQPAAGGAKAQ